MGTCWQRVESRPRAGTRGSSIYASRRFGRWPEKVRRSVRFDERLDAPVAMHGCSQLEGVPTTTWPGNGQTEPGDSGARPRRLSMHVSRLEAAATLPARRWQWTCCSGDYSRHGHGAFHCSAVIGYCSSGQRGDRFSGKDGRRVQQQKVADQRVKQCTGDWK